MRAGFEKHHRKTKCLDIAKGDVFITGIGLNKKGELFVPRKFVRGLIGLLHKAMKEEASDFKELIFGRMSAFTNITPIANTALEKKLYEKFKQYKISLKRFQTESLP